MSTPFDQKMHLTKLGIQKFFDGTLDNEIVHEHRDGDVTTLVKGVLRLTFLPPLENGTIMGKIELCQPNGVMEGDPVMHICRFEIPGDTLLDEVQLWIHGLPGIEIRFEHN